MTTTRVMGTETEFGISVPGSPLANAMVASSQVVNAYSAPRDRRKGSDRYALDLATVTGRGAAATRAAENKDNHYREHDCPDYGDTREDVRIAQPGLVERPRWRSLRRTHWRTRRWSRRPLARTA